MKRLPPTGEDDREAVRRGRVLFEPRAQFPQPLGHLLQPLVELGHRAVQRALVIAPDLHGARPHRRHRRQPHGGRLDAAGLKGRSLGGAQISTVHANWIVNTGGATAADVRGLIALCQAEVARHFGVTLRPEVQLVGEWEDAA